MEHRGRRSLVVLALVVATALTGCGWLQRGYDGGNTHSNDFEASITVDTVASLVEHTIPSAGDVLLVGDLIVGRDDWDLVAYDSNTCPRVDNGPCTEVWRYDLADVWSYSSDGVHIFLDTISGVVTLDRQGGVTWTWPETLVDPNSVGTGPGRSTVHQGQLVQYLATKRPDGKYDNKLAIFATAGCGTPTCAPRTVALDVGTPYAVAPSVFAENTAFLHHQGTLRAIDLATGSERWRAGLAGFVNGLAARDGRIHLYDEILGRWIVTFAVDGGPDCSGTPRLCQPIAVQATPGFAMEGATRDHVFGLLFTAGASGTEFHIVWHDRSCHGCQPVATSAGVGIPSPTDTLGVAGGVVFVHGEHAIHAFDEKATKGCSGTPKVCAPLWSAPLGNYQGGGPRIYGGRVYTGTVDGKVHVFSLPGDVG